MKLQKLLLKFAAKYFVADKSYESINEKSNGRVSSNTPTFLQNILFILYENKYEQSEESKNATQRIYKS